MADGALDLAPGSDRDDTRRRLEDLPGIGPWTASYIAMRALGDPDVFLPTDLGVRHALERLGAWSGPDDAAAAAERWAPWRSYALMHLWGTLGVEKRPGRPRTAGRRRRQRSPDGVGVGE